MKMSFVVNFNLCVQWTFQSKEGLNSSKQNSTLQRQSRCWDPHFWSLRCCFQSKLLVGVSQLKYSNFTPPGVQGAQKKKKHGWLWQTDVPLASVHTTEHSAECLNKTEEKTDIIHYFLPHLFVNISKCFVHQHVQSLSTIVCLLYFPGPKCSSCLERSISPDNLDDITGVIFVWLLQIHRHDG